GLVELFWDWATHASRSRSMNLRRNTHEQQLIESASGSQRKVGASLSHLRFNRRCLPQGGQRGTDSTPEASAHWPPKPPQALFTKLHNRHGTRINTRFSGGRSFCR